MMNELRDTKTRQPESEKITINMGFVDLGGIDLLVREGFYSNRSDFIRSNIPCQNRRKMSSCRCVTSSPICGRPAAARCTAPERS